MSKAPTIRAKVKVSLNTNTEKVETRRKPIPVSIGYATVSDSFSKDLAKITTLIA